jgi:hypothetical protein
VPIRTLLEGGALHLGLCDDRNMCELTHPAYPDERLIAGWKPESAKSRAHTRPILLAATAAELETVERGAWNGSCRRQHHQGHAGTRG